MRIADYPWFGPRHGMGWGWAPVSWEGQAICAVVAVVVVIAALVFGRSRRTLYIAIASAVFMVIVAAVTGTPPG